MELFLKYYSLCFHLVLIADSDTDWVSSDSDETIDISEIAVDAEPHDNQSDSVMKKAAATKESIFRELIERIRNEEFGCDATLSDAGKSLVAKHKERLGRSLERLPKDLYSKDSHFVLELIQNADDNDYPTEMFQ